MPKTTRGKVDLMRRTPIIAKETERDYSSLIGGNHSPSLSTSIPYSGLHSSKQPRKFINP